MKQANHNKIVHLIILVVLNSYGWRMDFIIHYWSSPSVGAESDQHVNICSFVVRCDRMWPSTQWHRVYTGSGNVPYVQFKSVGDFIPEPRCSKFTVGLQTRRRKMGVQEVRSDSGRKGQEWREPRYELSFRACARGLNLVVLLLCSSELDRSNESVCWKRVHPLL